MSKLSASGAGSKEFMTTTVGYADDRDPLDMPMSVLLSEEGSVALPNVRLTAKARVQTRRNAGVEDLVSVLLQSLGSGDLFLIV
jgi:hypothetical protein